MPCSPNWVAKVPETTQPTILLLLTEAFVINVMPSSVLSSGQVVPVAVMVNVRAEAAIPGLFAPPKHTVAASTAKALTVAWLGKRVLKL
jgi:hypothetical protein